MERLASALDLFQDIGGVSRPDEWLGIFIVPVDIVSDGHDEFFQIASTVLALLSTGLGASISAKMIKADPRISDFTAFTPDGKNIA